jgi:hypothetical protein
VYKIPAVIVDIDGTLADMGKGIESHRGPYDWSRVDEDRPVDDVVTIVRALSESFKIIIVSGRDRSCESETTNWLIKHDIQCDVLCMRPAGSNSPDERIKEDIYWSKIAPYYRVIAVLDDRNKVVDMWRRIGLTCLQVADGSF